MRATLKFRHKLSTMFYVANAVQMSAQIISDITSGVAVKIGDNRYMAVIYDIPAVVMVDEYRLTDLHYAEI